MGNLFKSKAFYTAVGIVCCLAMGFVLWKIGLDNATIIKVVGALAGVFGISIGSYAFATRNK